MRTSGPRGRVRGGRREGVHGAGTCVSAALWALALPAAASARFWVGLRPARRPRAQTRLGGLRGTASFPRRLRGAEPSQLCQAAAPWCCGDTWEVPSRPPPQGVGLSPPTVSLTPRPPARACALGHSSPAHPEAGSETGHGGPTGQAMTTKDPRTFLSSFLGAGHCRTMRPGRCCCRCSHQGPCGRPGASRVLAQGRHPRGSARGHRALTGRVVTALAPGGPVRRGQAKGEGTLLLQKPRLLKTASLSMGPTGPCVCEMVSSASAEKLTSQRGLFLKHLKIDTNLYYTNLKKNSTISRLLRERLSGISTAKFKHVST